MRGEGVLFIALNPVVYLSIIWSQALIPSAVADEEAFRCGLNEDYVTWCNIRDIEWL